mmetsp:Transcript_12553/g.17444  ORF Transcript_12553/g.17444 Transcript_12553/m.17444 type:complete len:240 (-) Transcript_12553:530-1249(-)
MQSFYFTSDNRFLNNTKLDSEQHAVFTSLWFTLGILALRVAAASMHAQRDITRFRLSELEGEGLSALLESLEPSAEWKSSWESVSLRPSLYFYVLTSVVLSTSFLVGEYLISLAYLSKFGLRLFLLVGRHLIRMELECQLAERALDLALVGVAFYSEDLVIVLPLAHLQSSLSVLESLVHSPRLRFLLCRTLEFPYCLLVFFIGDASIPEKASKLDVLMVFSQSLRARRYSVWSFLSLH